MKILFISKFNAVNVDIILLWARYVKLNLAQWVLAIGKPLHSGEPCCFSMASWNPSEKRERVFSGRLLVSDIHNTRHPPRHPMLSPREILFSFPEVQSARPLLSCIDFISSPDSRLLSLLLALHNSPLCGRSLKGTVPSSESSLFSRAKPSFEAFSLAFLESHYRALNATGKLRSLLSGNFAARRTTTTRL